MGTRGLVGFVIDGEVKASYNHYDSYPDAVGQDALNFARGMDESVKDKARAIKLVDPHGKPTVSTGMLHALGVSYINSLDVKRLDWYDALHPLQGNLQGYLDAGVMTDDANFLGDPDCEWAYLVNLDEEFFEVSSFGGRRTASFPLTDLPVDLPGALVRHGMLVRAQ